MSKRSGPEHFDVRISGLNAAHAAVFPWPWTLLSAFWFVVLLLLVAPPASGMVFSVTLIFLAGRFLAQRRHHTFCVTMAAVQCLFMPFGTILGVFTIVVLNRPSVKQLFAPPAQSAAGNPS